LLYSATLLARNQQDNDSSSGAILEFLSRSTQHFSPAGLVATARRTPRIVHTLGREWKKVGQGYLPILTTTRLEIATCSARLLTTPPHSPSNTRLWLSGHLVFLAMRRVLPSNSTYNTLASLCDMLRSCHNRPI